MKNKCKKCNKEFEASTKIKYCSKNCAYNIILNEISKASENSLWLGEYNIKK